MAFRAAVRLALCAILAGVLAGAPRLCAQSSMFRRGDSNADGAVDISDAITTLGALFLGQDAIRCDDAADANDDGNVDIADAVFILGFLFAGEVDIAAPGPNTCGSDPTEDPLRCESYSSTLCETTPEGDLPRWRPRGIGGGGALFSPGISPFDSDEIYMATDMTGVFHTTDFGASWTTLPFRQLQGGTHSQVRFTSDPGILYALDHADDRRTLVKSSDGGSTWSAPVTDPTEGEGYYLLTDLDDANRVLLTNWDTLFFSEDGGLDFDVVYVSPSDDGCIIGGAFWDGRDIYVGTGDGLLVSHDGGGRFDLEGPPGIPPTEIIVSFAGAREGALTRFFAVTFNRRGAWSGFTGAELWESAGVYCLDLGDAAWRQVGSGLTADDRPVFVATAANDVDTAYVAGGNVETFHPIVYRTADGGASWSSVFSTAGNANIHTGWSGSNGDDEWWFGEYALGFAVAPNDAERAVITDLGFVHVTSDGGETWRQAYVDPADQNPAGSDTPRGRSYRSAGVDPTSSWWLTWADADTLFTAMTDITAIRSEDGGASWSRLSEHQGLPLNSTYHTLVHPDREVMYAATSSVHDMYQSLYLDDESIDDGEGAVMVSTDRGASWRTLYDAGHPVVWLALDPQDGDTLYASVVHSTEGGIHVTGNLSAGDRATWRRLASPPRTEGHPFNIHVLDDGSLLATYSGRRDANGAFTRSSGVFFSDTEGASWEDRSHPGMTRWTKDVVIDPHDSRQDTWYAAVFSHWGTGNNEVGGVYRTTDRGRSWVRISDLYRVHSSTVDPRRPDRMFVTTESRGLWVTDNLRAARPDFVPVEDYPFKEPTRVFFNPHDPSEVWVTSFGGGLRVARERG